MQTLGQDNPRGISQRDRGNSLTGIHETPRPVPPFRIPPRSPFATLPVSHQGVFALESGDVPRVGVPREDRLNELARVAAGTYDRLGYHINGLPSNTQTTSVKLTGYELLLQNFAKVFSQRVMDTHGQTLRGDLSNWVHWMETLQVTALKFGIGRDTFVLVEELLRIRQDEALEFAQDNVRALHQALVDLELQEELDVPEQTRYVPRGRDGAQESGAFPPHETKSPPMTQTTPQSEDSQATLLYGNGGSTFAHFRRHPAGSSVAPDLEDPRLGGQDTPRPFAHGPHGPPYHGQPPTLGRMAARRAGRRKATEKAAENYASAQVTLRSRVSALSLMAAHMTRDIKQMLRTIVLKHVSTDLLPSVEHLDDIAEVLRTFAQRYRPEVTQAALYRAKEAYEKTRYENFPSMAAYTAAIAENLKVCTTLGGVYTVQEVRYRLLSTLPTSGRGWNKGGVRQGFTFRHVVVDNPEGTTIPTLMVWYGLIEIC